MQSPGHHGWYRRPGTPCCALGPALRSRGRSGRRAAALQEPTEAAKLSALGCQATEALPVGQGGKPLCDHPRAELRRVAALRSCCSLFWTNQAHLNGCLDGGIAMPARPLLEVSAAPTGRLPRVQPDPHLVHGSTPLTLDGESCLSADELN